MLALLFVLLAAPESEIRFEGIFAARRDPIVDVDTGARIGGIGTFSPSGPGARMLLRHSQPFESGFSLQASLDARFDGGRELVPVPAARAQRSSVSFDEAFLEWWSEAWLLRLGRQRISWEPGARGSILFARDGPPLDSLTISTSRPWHGITLDLAAIRLDDERGHPWIAAQRVTYAPAPILRVGAQRTILCCEAGSAVRLSDAPAIFIAIYENEAGHRLNFDQIASVSAELTLLGFSAWVEHGGTDLRGYTDSGIPAFVSPANMAGASFARAPIALRFEWADTEDPVVGFYGHNRYREGHTHLEQSIGHPAGGRAFSIFADARMTLGAHEIGAYFLEERMNLHTPTHTRRSRLGLTARYANLSLLAGLIEERRASHAVWRSLEARLSISFRSLP